MIKINRASELRKAIAPVLAISKRVMIDVNDNVLTSRFYDAARIRYGEVSLHLSYSQFISDYDVPDCSFGLDLTELDKALKAFGVAEITVSRTKTGKYPCLRLSNNASMNVDIILDGMKEDVKVFNCPVCPIEVDNLDSRKILPMLKVCKSSVNKEFIKFIKKDESFKIASIIAGDELVYEIALLDVKNDGFVSLPLGEVIDIFKNAAGADIHMRYGTNAPAMFKWSYCGVYYTVIIAPRVENED